MTRASTKKGSQASTKSNGPKVLRIGIVQRGKIIEERSLKRRETVTLGSAPKCTFQVSSESFPKLLELFSYDGKSYFLNFDEGVSGRIQVDEDQVADFRALEARGLVVNRGGKKAVKLTDRSRGKVMVGDVTVLFQFKTVSPAPVRPVLPPDVRGSFLQNIDTQFASILIIVALLQISFLTYARTLPYVEPGQSIEELSESYQKLIMPDREPTPPQAPTEEAEEEEADDKQAEAKPKKPPKKPVKKPKKELTDAEKAAAAKAARDARRKKVAGKGLLGVLGQSGKGGSEAVSDVFREGSDGTSLEGAFSGIQGVDIAEEAGQSGSRGGGSGESVSVGGLGTGGGGRVSATSKKREAKVSGQVKSQVPEVDGTLDQATIAAVVRRQQSAIKTCYETALKRNPNLRGKLVIIFEIDGRGRVRDVDFGGSLSGKSSSMESCIKTRVRRWRFPRPDDGESTFAEAPFVLQPGN